MKPEILVIREEIDIRYETRAGREVYRLDWIWRCRWGGNRDDLRSYVVGNRRGWRFSRQFDMGEVLAARRPRKISANRSSSDCFH